MNYSAVDEEQEERSFYYGGASVPFLWESRPGTPKHNHFSEFSLPPPLTPPPSYYSSSEILSTPKRKNKVKTKLTRILSMSLFLDLRKSNNSRNKKPNYVSGSSYSSSTFSSSPPHSLRRPVSRGKKSPVRYNSNKEYELRSSPTSTLCYSNGMKRTLFSVPTGKALTIGNTNKV